MACAGAAAVALAFGLAAAAAGPAGKPTQAPMNIALENEFARYEISAAGKNLHLVDKRTGADYCAHQPASACAAMTRAGAAYPATAASYRDGKITLTFGEAGASAVLRVAVRAHYFVFEVLSVSGEGVEELVFAQLPLTLRGRPDEPFACCALALNLQTNVPQVPRASDHLWAACYPRFGLAGAKVALIACPQSELRAVMQEVVSAADDLPHSPIGGPWALGQEINEGSYLFNFGNLTEKTADDWIKLAQTLGFNQIDFHGGQSFRFGDCRPNPEWYPRGFASLKAVVDRLHAAGIKAGLHTYAFFIARDCPWVTPAPDPRLAKDATFTLAAPLGAKDTSVRVAESTEGMSAITGFFVRNSVTLQVDDELITYTGVCNEPPGFAGCQRGAWGTRPAAHAAGARAHHLKECFGLFVPDGDSTLLSEVAAKTAEAFNTCGFDMIYLDALDGEDILGGAENAWHYGSKFVFEIWKRLDHPALMEMSTFHHHLWPVRSRMGAWDHPTRSHKRFIDIHCAANEENRRMFLPGQLGWWAVKTWTGGQGEPTFSDDIEYLCCKALATDTGLSLMGVDPENITQAPALGRLAEIFKQYEDLRHARVVPESVKAQLRAPGEEFTLTRDAHGKPQFRPAHYAKHKVEGLEGWSNAWRVTNRFGPQPAQLRIEALLAAGPYDNPGNVTVADFADPGEFSDRDAAPGVEADLRPSSVEVKAGGRSGCYTALSGRKERKSSWAKAAKAFAAPLDLSARQGLGVWIHGDGQGEVLNFQLRSPEHLVAGIGEHYVIVDFEGWRYFESIEPEGERYEDYGWPYGGAYAIYRESVDYAQVASLGLWYNNLPPGKKVTCYLSPIKAVPLVPVRLVNPAVTIGDDTIVFPTEIGTGCYLEFRPPSDCRLYGPDGKLLSVVRPEGEAPTLASGANQVTFRCDAPGGPNPRARVTVMSQGEPLRE
jgi:hypothetical protein